MTEHVVARSEEVIRADPASYRRRWSLIDSDGIRHLPLCENDADALWTPIACGQGIAFPGSQSRNPVTCPDCIAARREHTTKPTAPDRRNMVESDRAEVTRLDTACPGCGAPAGSPEAGPCLDHGTPGARPLDEGICAWAGHDWRHVGGGLDVCANCDEERWA